MKFTIYNNDNRPYLCKLEGMLNYLNLESIEVEVVNGNENIYLNFQKNYARIEPDNSYYLCEIEDLNFAYITRDPEPLKRLYHNSQPIISYTYIVPRKKIRKWGAMGENSKSNHVAYDRMIKFLRNDNNHNKTFVEEIEEYLKDEMRELTEKEQEKLEQARKNKEKIIIQIWRK